MSTASPRDIITEALDPAVKAAMDEHVLKVCRALGEILSARGYTIAPPGYRVVREGDLDAVADALRWPDECPRGKRITSNGGLVQYTILFYGGSEPGWPALYRWAARECSWSAPCETYEAAKSAAQADYERRVVAALSPALRALVGEAK